MKGYLLIYALAVLGTIGSAYRPVIGLFIYIAFAMVRPQFMWGFAGDFNNISFVVGVALLVSWAVSGFGGAKFGRSAPIVAILAAFTVWCYLSATQGINTAMSTAWSIELLKTVLPFIAGVTLLNTTTLANRMLWVIVLAHGYIGWDMNSWYYFRGYNRILDNGYGGMDNNSFALSLVTALGPAVALGLATKKWHERGAAFACAGLIFHTILLTYSRGALMGVLAAGAAAAIIVPKRPGMIGLMLVALLVAARLAGPTVMSRFGTAFVGEEERDSSAQSRVDLWNAAFEVGMENPIFGIGPRNFSMVSGNYGYDAGKEAHSTWMQAIAEVGFPGFFMLAGFYLIAMARLWPIARQRWVGAGAEEGPLAAAVLVSLVGFAVCAQFVTMPGLETPYYVTMVGAALIKIHVRASEKTALVPAGVTSGFRLERAAPARAFRRTPADRSA